MKKTIYVLAFLCVLYDFAFATLWDRGSGLIYDDVLDITWLQDANLPSTEGFGIALSWDAAIDYIEGMNNAEYLGYNNWRLPDASNQDGTGPDFGLNVTESELGHMFYNNLGGTSGVFPGATFTNGNGKLLSFDDLQCGLYWFGNEIMTAPGHPDHAIDFHFTNDADAGYQGHHGKAATFYVWAVRDGDVNPVPEPATMLLFVIGITGVFVFRRRK